MESSKVNHCSVIKKIFISLGFLIFFFLCWKGLAWPQNPFEAILTFDRIDRDCEVDELKQNEVKLGFDDNYKIVYSPPPPPGSVKYCVKAFIDPNHTTIDGDKLNFNPEYGVEWYKAILPFPEEKACWGIKLLGGDPDGSEPVSVTLTWDSNALGSGVFKLARGRYEVLSNNMKEDSDIIINGLESGDMIRIEYYNKNICSNPSVLATICIGGEEGKENVCGSESSVYEFLNIGTKVYKSLWNLIPEESIRYIFYNPYVIYLEKDDSKVFFVDPVDTDITISQKKRLKEYITEWPVEKWSECLPEPLILVFYILDHGIGEDDVTDPNTNPYIFIDPISFDPNNPDEKKLYPKDLDNWLDVLEDNLLSQGIYEFEIITIIEACYSNGFLEMLWDNNPNFCQMKSNLSKKTFITSADGPADISNVGRASFSWKFWEAMEIAIIDNPVKLPRYLEYAFEKAEDFVPQNQSPRFEHCYDPNIFFDKIAGDSPATIPYVEIEKVKTESYDIDSNNPILLEPSLLTFILNIDCDLSIKKVWTIIYPPDCSDKSCRKQIEPLNTNIYDLDGNQCIFQPDYLFCCPGIYKLYFYAKGENDSISDPAPYFFHANIPKFLDSNEPDNKSEEATICYEGFHINSLHDTNDIDWIKFPAAPDEEYEIRFDLLCAHPSDPNIFLFNVILSSDDKLSEGDQLELTKMDDYSFLGKWENNVSQDPVFVYLKITLDPNINYQDPVPYKISIKISPTAGAGVYFIGKVEGDHISIVNDLYIFNELNKRYYPNWVYDFNTFQPEYFIFNYSFDTSSIPHWGLGGEDLGPVDSNFPSIFINPEPSRIPTDPNAIEYDCDGIIDQDDPDPNQLDIILHPGLNLFRYPLWTGDPAGVDLYKIFYNPNLVSPDDSDKIKGIRVFSYQKSEWDCCDANSSEIYLPDKSGCLIYLDSNADLRIPLTSAYNLIDPYNKWGTCLKDLDPNILSDYSEMNLDTGLNLVGFIGHKVYFVDYSDPGNPKICFDFSIPAEGGLNSCSVIHSFSEPVSFNQLKDPNFTIIRRDNLAGKWESSYSFFGRASGKRNNIKINEAYLIYSKEKRDVWLPEHKLYKSY